MGTSPLRSTQFQPPSAFTAAPAAGEVDWDALLLSALNAEGVTVIYQPIVDLARMTVAGYEALTRFSGPAGLTPDRWFAAAAARGLAPALEAVTLRAALARRAELPRNCFLTVNLEPESLLSPVVLEVFSLVGDLRGLVVEITEHRPIVDRASTERALAGLRRRGALVALDDAGAGYAGLQQVLDLRPSILKLDRALVDGVERDEAKVALIEMLGVFANKIDAWLLAEGVETEGDARRLVELGVPLAQGYYFGRPQAPWCGLDDTCRDVLDAAVASSTANTLHHLVDAAPWIPADATADAPRRLLAGEAPYLVVLDEHRRPLGVLCADALPALTLVGALVANASSSAKEVAHRLATRRPADTSSPVLVTDNAGRYLGVVTIQRLLAALTDS